LPSNQELLPVTATCANGLDVEAEGVVRSIATLNAVHPTKAAINSENRVLSEIRLEVLVIFVLLV
jgi:hypothetical protein